MIKDNHIILFGLLKKSFMVVLLGASGAIGKELLKHLNNRGIEVKAVSDFNNAYLSYQDMFELEVKPDLIIDCSKKNYDYYLKLYGHFRSVPILHFSTYRIRTDINFDSYDYYKLDVLKIINKFDYKIVVFNDLFKYKNNYLGFWSKLSSNSKILASRDILELDISNLFMDLNFPENVIYGYQCNLKTIKISSCFSNLLLRTKVYKILEMFNYYIVK